MSRNNNKDKISIKFPPIISWERDHTDSLDRSLMKRFPESGESIQKSKAFVVKEHERAILLKNGELISEMESGTYELDKDARHLGTEIIWVDTVVQNIPWGIPQINGIKTKDGFLIGMFGELKARINNALSFYKYVIGGEKSWTLGDLKQWIKSLLHTSLRDIYSDYELQKIFQEDREVVINKISAKMIEELHLYGLTIESFGVLGYKAPDIADEFVKSEQNITLNEFELIKKIQEQKYKEHDVIQNRVNSLERRRVDLQDQLMEGHITKEEYESLVEILNDFLNESKEELKKLYSNNTEIPFERS